MKESIKFEETDVSEEVKSREQELTQFKKDNKSIYDHTGSIKNRIQELEDELEEAARKLDSLTWGTIKRPAAWKPYNYSPATNYRSSYSGANWNTNS